MWWISVFSVYLQLCNILDNLRRRKADDIEKVMQTKKKEIRMCNSAVAQCSARQSDSERKSEIKKSAAFVSSERFMLKACCGWAPRQTCTVQSVRHMKIVFQLIFGRQKTFHYSCRMCGECHAIHTHIHHTGVHRTHSGTDISTSFYQQQKKAGARHNDRNEPLCIYALRKLRWSE